MSLATGSASPDGGGRRTQPLCCDGGGEASGCPRRPMRCSCVEEPLVNAASNSNNLSNPNNTNIGIPCCGCPVPAPPRKQRMGARLASLLHRNSSKPQPAQSEIKDLVPSPLESLTAIPQREIAGVLHPRRTRSAERSQSLNEISEGVVARLPRQSSLQTPAVAASRQQPGPPPPYEAVANKGNGLPPSYEEYLVERLNRVSPCSDNESLARRRGGQGTPPPAWSPRAQSEGLTCHQPTTATTTNRNPLGKACSCANCKRAVRLFAEQLRVSLPQTSGRMQQQQQQQLALQQQQQRQNTICSCHKCMVASGMNPRYRPNNDQSDDLLFSLDTTTVMQGVLTDGIALCSLM